MGIVNQKMIRLAGIISIIGGLLCAMSDLLLRCGPVSGKEISLEFMAASIPYGCTMAGAILGVAVIPLWLFILFPLYHALKPAGKCFAVPVVLMFFYNFAVSTVYHGAYAFYSAGYYALGAVNDEAKAILLEMIGNFMAFRSGLLYMITPTILLGSVWFIVTVLFRPTLYKRWMAIFTPLLSIPVMILSHQLLPAPIGRYIVPPAASMVYAIFFIFTTIVTWNIEKKGQL